MIKMNEVMTVNEVCKYLRFSRKTVINLLNKGEIPGNKFGGRWRILKSEVDNYLRGKAKKK